MASRTFWDLVKLALPEDVHPRELLALAPQKWWDENPYLACAYALRKSPRINWDAYVARNEDVRQSGMDPCLHWLKHGIFEGRKLISWHKLKGPENPGRPLVSVVVINYNNAHLLEKSIGSVVNQTLRNIEIIVVDDCSTDESLTIIQGFAANDRRIKVLVNPENSLTLITRKRGVEAATGRYLMFLDSDDFLAPNACEVAVKEIEKGYDAVKFGVNIVNLPNVPQEAIQDCDISCNKGENEEYFYNDITNAIFRDGKTSWNLWSLIYLREITVAAFMELGEERLTGPDDLLATMAIMRRARSMLKIADRLIYYYFGPGITVSSNKDKIFKYTPAICKTTRFIYDYAKQYCSNIEPTQLYLSLCEHVSKRFLPIAMEPDAPSHFRKLVDTLGIMNVLRVLRYYHADEADKIAALFQPEENGKRPPKHIGLYVSKVRHSELQDFAHIIGVLLSVRNYEITLFVEGEGGKASFATLAKNIYQLPEWKNGSDFIEHLELLAQAISDSGIELMLHAACHVDSLWEAALLQSRNIPLIFVYPGDSQTLDKDPDSSAGFSYEHSFRCARAVICATSREAARLTAIGINAAHLMPPAIGMDNNKALDESFQIATLAKYLRTSEDIDQCFLILQAARRILPWITMCLVGELKSVYMKRYLLDKLREFDLFNNLFLTDAVEEDSRYLNSCLVLLTVGKTGPNPFEIALAQAHGLPVIGYHAGHRVLRHGSVTLRQYGDYGAAGAEIAGLLEDEQKLERLSAIASDCAKQNSAQFFTSRLISLLEHFYSENTFAAAI